MFGSGAVIAFFSVYAASFFVELWATPLRRLVTILLSAFLCGPILLMLLGVHLARTEDPLRLSELHRFLTIFRYLYTC